MSDPIGQIVEGAPCEDRAVPHDDPAEGWKATYDTPCAGSGSSLDLSATRPSYRTAPHREGGQ